MSAAVNAKVSLSKTPPYTWDLSIDNRDDVMFRTNPSLPFTGKYLGERPVLCILSLCGIGQRATK